MKKIRWRIYLAKKNEATQKIYILGEQNMTIPVCDCLKVLNINL